MARGVYQGADTMRAEEYQSLWDVMQGKKRHEKKTLEQLGKRDLFGRLSDIGEYFLPEGVKQVVDVGSKQLEQQLFKLPEYEEEGSFWGSKEIASIREGDRLFRKRADKTLLEGIIGGVGDYVGGGGGFDLASLFGGGQGFEPMNYAGDFSPELLSQFSYGPQTKKESESGIPFLAQGGQVPKYYGGGSVSGDSPPTIAGYFSQQGKTLGGSNTQSLAEKLGRK